MRKALVVFLFISLYGFGQYPRWKSYFSYNTITSVYQSNDGLVYGVAGNSVFSYDPTGNEVTQITTVNGLMGDDIHVLSVIDNTMVVGYENGMMGVHNLSDGTFNLDSSIHRNLVIGGDRKTINHFYVKNNLLYLSTNYGISVYNLDENVFVESYFFGENNSPIQVNQAILLNGFIYAATEQGLYKAPQDNLNLVLESAWTKLANGQWKGLGLVGSSLMGTTQTNSQSVFYSIADDIALQLHSESGTMQSTTFSSGKMVIAFSNKVVSVDSSESVRQIATASNDLEGVSFTSALATNDAVYIGTVDNGLFQQTASETRVVSPNGPLKNDIFDLTVLPNDELWIVHGAFQRNYNPYPLNSFGLSHLNGGAWQNIPYSQLLGAKSLVSVTANPNNPSQVFVAAMHQGILELNDGVATNLWDHTNSGLESIDPEEFGENPSYRSVRVRDIAFDNEGSMWSITSFIANGLKKRMQSGTWVDVDLIPVIEKVTNPTGYSKLEISPNNEVYVGSSSSGLIGYSERNGTPLLRSLSTSQNLPSVDVRSIALDNDDNLWIGTPEGLRVLFGVSRMFTLDNVQASTIIIEEGGKVGELLSNQFITAIEVDGNNQKWVSTANAGVFLFSEDGKKTLEHFTKDNSPLPSSSIRSLAYDETTGQIYIGTPIGLVAFQGNASSPGENLSNVEVYPNPVRPGYTGKVTVRGLLADCVVKITDIVGNAVHETTSSGGSVQWNLQSFDGNRVRSGVYLIFVTNSDGTETAVEKVMIIN